MRNYRVYVTDCLQISIGAKSSPRYADSLRPEETRTSEEIISHISDGLARLGEEAG